MSEQDFAQKLELWRLKEVRRKIAKIMQEKEQQPAYYPQYAGIQVRQEDL